MSAASRISRNAAGTARGLAFAIALVAASAGGFAQAQTNHPVSITIVPNTTTPIPPGTCTTQKTYLICVSEDPVDLTKDTEPIIVTWTIASADWVFDKKGIDIKKGGWKISEKGPTQYSANRKKDGALYKYVINVKKGDGSVALSWDPIIMN